MITSFNNLWNDSSVSFIDFRIIVSNVMKN